MVSEMAKIRFERRMDGSLLPEKLLRHGISKRDAVAGRRRPNPVVLRELLDLIGSPEISDKTARDLAFTAFGPEGMDIPAARRMTGNRLK